MDYILWISRIVSDMESLPVVAVKIKPVIILVCRLRQMIGHGDQLPCYSNTSLMVSKYLEGGEGNREKKNKKQSRIPDPHIRAGPTADILGDWVIWTLQNLACGETSVRVFADLYISDHIGRRTRLAGICASIEWKIEQGFWELDLKWSSGYGFLDSLVVGSAEAISTGAFMYVSCDAALGFLQYSTLRRANQRN